MLYLKRGDCLFFKHKDDEIYGLLNHKIIPYPYEVNKEELQVNPTYEEISHVSFLLLSNDRVTVGKDYEMSVTEFEELLDTSGVDVWIESFVFEVRDLINWLEKSKTLIQYKGETHQHYKEIVKGL